MQALQKLKLALAERGVSFVEEPSSITVKAKSAIGFDVSLHEGEETAVFF